MYEIKIAFTEHDPLGKYEDQLAALMFAGLYLIGQYKYQNSKVRTYLIIDFNGKPFVDCHYFPLEREVRFYFKDGSDKVKSFKAD